MIKAIIFDFYGVFRTDTYKTWLARNNIAREGGYFEASLQADMGKMTRDEFLKMISQLTGRLVTTEEMDADATIDHGVIEISKALHKIYKIGLVSNASSGLIRKIMSDNNLERLFDKIVISSEVAMVKPNSDIFEYTLKELDIAAHEAILIDDNKNNVEQAEKLGITSIQFTSTVQLKRDLSAIGINVTHSVS